jgi:hypothetical protein
VKAAAAIEWAKFPCIWCGTKVEQRIDYAEDYEIICSACSGHAYHDSPSFIFTCSVCVAKLWRVRLRAVWIFLRLIFVLGGVE